mmetsp:Transcript_34284/g.85420  ORF Transcript_34284/g.85420 Transcript_34284/m.85420 type:complete len:238 (+) Transcript_34284:1223-1936(+)
MFVNCIIRSMAARCKLEAYSSTSPSCDEESLPLRASSTQQMPHAAYRKQPVCVVSACAHLLTASLPRLARDMSPTNAAFCAQKRASAPNAKMVSRPASASPKCAYTGECAALSSRLLSRLAGLTRLKMHTYTGSSSGSAAATQGAKASTNPSCVPICRSLPSMSESALGTYVSMFCTSANKRFSTDPLAVRSKKERGAPSNEESTLACSRREARNAAAVSSNASRHTHSCEPAPSER